jgi:hypothetical protein
LLLKRFVSRAKRRGRGPSLGFDALSMVMVDPSFDGSIFRPGRVFYAQDLQSEGWQVRFPAQEIGASVMVVLVDIGGNEARLLIRAEGFGTHSQPSDVRISPLAC